MDSPNLQGSRQVDLFKPRAFETTSLEYILDTISVSTRQTSVNISAKRKQKYSQYFTPMAVAKQMASMMNLEQGNKLGDKGAGTGILSATALAMHYSSNDITGKPITVNLHEIDESLYSAIESNNELVSLFAQNMGHSIPQFKVNGDYTKELNQFIHQLDGDYDAIILNPPYKKLSQTTYLAKAFRQVGVPVPNIYAVFILISIAKLRSGGELVAIVPRSFCNGDYFRKFRKWVRQHGSIDWIVRYKGRSNTFRNENVLQENIIFRFTKGVEQAPRIRITLCNSPDDDPEQESLVPSSDVLYKERSCIFVPGNNDERQAMHALAIMPYSLNDLGLQVNTGKLEDFRYREHLHFNADISGTVPVIYPQHWNRGEFEMHWSADAVSKPCFLSKNSLTEKKLIPSGVYVLIKRISANDDRGGRCHACVVTPQNVPGQNWAIDNHIQVISAVGGLFDETRARNLVEYLSSETVNSALRVISGTTQINCNDLKVLRFPGCLF